MKEIKEEKALFCALDAWQKLARKRYGSDPTFFSRKMRIVYPGIQID